MISREQLAAVALVVITCLYVIQPVQISRLENDYMQVCQCLSMEAKKLIRSLDLVFFALTGVFSLELQTEPGRE